MVRKMRWLLMTGGMALSACSGASNGNSADNVAGAAPPAPTAVANVVVQPLPTATPTAYPPCSATVRDHCVEP